MWPSFSITAHNSCLRVATFNWLKNGISPKHNQHAEKLFPSLDMYWIQLFYNTEYRWWIKLTEKHCCQGCEDAKPNLLKYSKDGMAGVYTTLVQAKDFTWHINTSVFACIRLASLSSNEHTTAHVHTQTYITLRTKMYSYGTVNIVIISLCYTSRLKIDKDKIQTTFFTRLTPSYFILN